MSTRELHRIECDSCGRIACDAAEPGYIDPREAIAMATIYGWQVGDDCDLCPDCRKLPMVEVSLR